MRLRYYLPVLLPLIILIGTGLRGLDFGLHWDELPWQVGPVKHMVQAHTILPGRYYYPSFDYWLNLLVLTPDMVGSRRAGESFRAHLLHALDSHAYLMRLRLVYLLITSLTLLWVYLVVLNRGGSWAEALFAALLLGCSWEIAYHLRWVATDGMLMQFAALTVLLAIYALKSGQERWLIAAAVVAGLACGTKYPGGLVLLPVSIAGFFRAPGRSIREIAMRQVKVLATFSFVYLATTPATVLQPAKLLKDLLWVSGVYGIGHGGHTVGRGFEHAWRMLEYFSTVLFSPYLMIALLMFVLAVIGVAVAVARNWREATVFLAFPGSYALYFSTQGAMVVRNLLAVVPFVAVAAAHGAAAVGEFIGKRNALADRVLRSRWRRTAWAGILGAALCLNAAWLVLSAEGIRERQSDRFLREAADHVRTHAGTKFFLSPRIKREMAVLEPRLDDVTADPAKAEVLMLYAREGMQRWHDWPANHRGLTQACFGPREVNFDMYPNWWGDDRIVAISRRCAEQIHLHVAGVSADPALREPVLSARAVQHSTKPALVSADSLPSSWALPSIDPRLLVSSAEAQAILGELSQGPASGGWELDGTACTFITPDGMVVSVAIISTGAFDLERHDPQSAVVPNVGVSAYAKAKSATGEVRLFARNLKNAVVAQLSSGSPLHDDATKIAGQFAQTALEHLDAVEE
jgi:4-amino-4-deoxy-L-arabinose transferase-like glycosyltransferase